MENNTTTTPTTITNATIDTASITHDDVSSVAAHYRDYNTTTTLGRTRRRQQKELRMLPSLVPSVNNSSNTSLLLRSDTEKRQEAAMLFQDENLLPRAGMTRRSETLYYYPTTSLLILLMVAIYIHQWKTRQTRKQVLASHRVLVDKRAIHRAFLAVVSHPPRTVRRLRRQASSSSSFTTRRRPYESLYSRPQSSLELLEGDSGSASRSYNNRSSNFGLRWKRFVHSVKSRCGECIVRSWKALSNGHLSGLPLLLYNAHILWSCRELEVACHYYDDSTGSVVINNSGSDDDNDYHNNNNHPLQYLRLLVALAFLTFGMELVITRCLLQSPLLATPPPQSSSSSSASASSSDAAATSSTTTTTTDNTLTITATNLTVVNGVDYHAAVGIPGPPLSTRPEYQTRQQREIAQQRRNFWRQSLLHKPMGTMTAITTALLWIHRAHYHYIYQQQQQQQQQQQEQDGEKDDGSARNNIHDADDMSSSYQTVSILPLLSNPSFLNSSATMSLISTSLCLFLLLVFSRYSHPGWAVVCGTVVGLLWGDACNHYHYYYYQSNTNAGESSNNGSNNNKNESNMDDDEGLLHFLAEPYYNNWLIGLLIFLSLLSLKRTRKWSGWIPCIDYVATTPTSSTTSQQEQQQQQQQRQANLRRSTPTGTTRSMIGIINEQEIFGFMDDDDRGDPEQDTDDDTDSDSQNEDNVDFLHDNNHHNHHHGDLLGERQNQSFASHTPSHDNNNNNEDEIYGRLPALGDFLDDDDDEDGDLELARQMSLQPQYNVRPRNQ